jgi:hypothetical protein
MRRQKLFSPCMRLKGRIWFPGRSGTRKCAGKGRHTQQSVNCSKQAQLQSMSEQKRHKGHHRFSGSVLNITTSAGAGDICTECEQKLPKGMMEIEAVNRRRGFRPYSSASCPIRVNPTVLKIPPICRKPRSSASTASAASSSSESQETRATTKTTEEMEEETVVWNEVYDDSMQPNHGCMYAWCVPRTGGR